MRRSIIAALVVLSLGAALPAAASSRQLYASLDANNEVGGGDGNATGWAVIRLRPETSQVCFRITTDGLTTDPIAAHIHDGAAGVNGPVVVNFDWAANGSGANADGCVGADLDLIKDIHRNPGEYYVNVHNPTVPSGAVRGQLVHG